MNEPSAGLAKPAAPAHGIHHVMAVAIDGGVVAALALPVRVLLDCAQLRTVALWSQLVFSYIAIGFIFALPLSLLALIRGGLSRAARAALAVSGSVALGVVLTKPVGHFGVYVVLAVMLSAPVLLRLALLQTELRASYARYGLLVFSLAFVLFSLCSQQVVRTALFDSDRALYALRSLRSVTRLDARSPRSPQVVSVQSTTDALALALIIRVHPLRNDSVFDQRFRGFVTIARNSARFLDVRANSEVLGQLATQGVLPDGATVACVSGDPERVALCARERLTAASTIGPMRLELIFTSPNPSLTAAQYQAFIARVDRAIAAVLPVANGRTPLRQALVVLLGGAGFALPQLGSSVAFRADDGQRVALLISAPGVRPAFVAGAVSLAEAEDSIALWTRGASPPSTTVARAAQGIGSPPRLLLTLNPRHPESVTLTDGRYLLGVDRRVPTYTLIDLSLDPRGTVNRADILPGVRDAMSHALTLWSRSSP